MIRSFVTTLFVMVALSSAAITFSLPRIKSIAYAMNMKIPDNLGTNINNDSTWTWKGNRIHLCTDSYGFICHIGYKLFNNVFFESYPSPAILCFIERYVLEQDLNISNNLLNEYDHLNDVVIVSGKLDYLKSIDKYTPFTINNIQRRLYKASWKTNKGDVVITFSANCQNILGGNIIDLESWVKERMNIQKSSSDMILLSPWQNANITQNKSMQTKDYGSYLSNLIGSKIHLVVRDGKWKPYYSINNKVLSIANIMLTGISDNDIQMNILFNEYGYKKETLHVSLRQFISFCIGEGSKIFLGIKSINTDVLTGTLFIYNEPLGYNHMLSFSFPINILNGSKEHIKATMYAYIPLQNVTEKFFNQNLYENYDKYD